MSGLNSLVATMVFGSMAAAAAVVHLQKEPPASAAASVSKAAVSIAPVTHPPSAGNTAILYPDSRGHFFADLYVRGLPVRSLVDTGASLVSFSTEDAAKLGIRASPSDRKARFSTANGTVEASIVRVPDMRIQGITVYDVEAAIMPAGAMQGSLLGMSFMKKLASFESRSTSMVMRK